MQNKQIIEYSFGVNIKSWYDTFKKITYQAAVNSKFHV